MISRSINVSMMTFLTVTLLTMSAAFACEDCESNKDAKAEQIGFHSVSEAIESASHSVIAFHSTSCGTCKVQKPRLQALLLKEQNSQMKNIFLDFDSEVEVRKSLKVAYPSTVIVFKNGEEVARVIGETDEAKLQKILNKSLL